MTSPTTEPDGASRTTRWGVLRTVGTVVAVAAVVVVASVAVRPDADLVQAEHAFGGDVGFAQPVPARPLPRDLEPPAQGGLELETLTVEPFEPGEGSGLITIVASSSTESHGELVLTAWANGPEELCLHAPGMAPDAEDLCAPPPTQEDGFGLTGAWTDDTRVPPLTCVAALLPSEATTLTVDGEEVPLAGAFLDGHEVMAALRCWDDAREVGGFETTYGDGTGEGVSR